MVHHLTEEFKHPKSSNSIAILVPFHIELLNEALKHPQIVNDSIFGDLGINLPQKCYHSEG